MIKVLIVAIVVTCVWLMMELAGRNEIEYREEERKREDALRPGDISDLEL